MSAVTALSALARLREVLGEIVDLQRAAELLQWDQETYMPPGGVEDRAAQLSTLQRLAHERFLSEEVARLLERAEAEVEGLPYDSDEASLVRVTRRDLELAARVPPELVAARAGAAARAASAWREARAASDWSRFAPHMETSVELSRRLAEAIGYEERPYDALLRISEPGLSTERVEALFAELRTFLVPLVRRLAELTDRVDDRVLDRPCPRDPQLALALEVIRELGYDLNRGRQDLSAHPFCAAFGPGDVRLTTRVGSRLRDAALLSSVHESGHAMYEQGIPRSLDRTPLWGGASPGVHESQSRLWENQVGRSRPFWEWCLPRLRLALGETVADVEVDRFWRALNKVRPGYVRVEADEVTYNLHVLLRFEIEQELLEGRLRVVDVPDAWAVRLRDHLGLERPSDALGPLQDIHWCSGLGHFVGYTLGNLIAAQLMEAARRDLPDLDRQIAGGRFGGLLGWLREHVHRHGRKFTPDELVRRATGSTICAGPWIAYVEVKVAAVYGLT
jgi:carboxypeptidase Taq